MDELKRDKSGKLTPDSSAAVAIEGMPSAPISAKLEAYETLYQQWSEKRPRWARKAIAWLARDPLRIARAEVAELATAVSGYIIAEKSAGIREQFYQDYLRVQVRDAKFRSFLIQHFPTEYDRGANLNLSLYEIAISVMLDQAVESRGQGLKKEKT